MVGRTSINNIQIGQNSKQDGRVGLELTSSHENTKITTNCWTILSRLEATIRYPITKDKEEATMRWYEGCFCDITIPYLLCGQPINRNITIWQKLSHRCESSKPHVGSPHGLAFRRGAPGAFGIESQQGSKAGAPQDWEKQETPLLGGATEFHVHWVPGTSRDSIRIWSDLPAGLGSSPGKAGISCGSLWRQSSPGDCHFAKSWPLVWRHEDSEAPGQTARRVGTQPHPSANRLPKVLQGTQLSIIPLRDTAPPTRGIRQLQPPVGRHQCLLSGSLPQAPVSTSPTRVEHQKQERLQPCSLQKGIHTES